MGRMVRIINYTMTTKDIWYKVFSESDYNNNRVKEIKVKIRETDTTVDHFRYAFVADSIGPIAIASFMTSVPGFTVMRNVKKLYCYIPDVDGAVIEIEVIYF